MKTPPPSSSSAAAVPADSPPPDGNLEAAGSAPRSGTDLLRNLLNLPLPLDRLRLLLPPSEQHAQGSTSARRQPTLFAILIHRGLRSSGITADLAVEEFVVELASRWIQAAGHHNQVQVLTTRAPPPQPQPQPQWSLPPSLHAFVPQRRNRDRLVRFLLRPYDPVTRTLCGFALLFWVNRAQLLPARLEGRREEEGGQAPEEERVDPTQQDVEGLRNSREYILSDISNALSLVKLLEEDVSSTASPLPLVVDVPSDTPFEVAITIKNLILHKVVQDFIWGPNILAIIGGEKCVEPPSQQDQRGRR